MGWEWEGVGPVLLALTALLLRENICWASYSLAAASEHLLSQSLLCL